MRGVKGREQTQQMTRIIDRNTVDSHQVVPRAASHDVDACIIFVVGGDARHGLEIMEWVGVAQNLGQGTDEGDIQ